jgi:flagellin-like hook-associated protein FlgL
MAAALAAGGGGETSLLRDAVAALLNSAQFGGDYPLSQSQIKTLVFDTISNGSSTLEGDVQGILNNWNTNTYCPLS